MKLPAPDFIIKWTIFIGGTCVVVSILYVQENETIAKTIKDQMDHDEVEFLVASSAKDAFVIFEERKIVLTLVDANIPDMKLRDFVDKCCIEYPEMLLNVCMDVPDAKYIFDISGRGNVKKIFLPPWKVEDVVKGIKETVDVAYIDNDLLRRQEEFAKEEAQFEKTLANLKASLVKQQYSYNKIAPFFNKCLESFVMESRYGIEVKKLVIMTCSAALKLGTTVKIQTLNLSDCIRQNIEEACAGNDNVIIDGIDNCLIGDVPKHILARIVLCNRMLAHMVSLISDTKVNTGNSKKAVINVDSRYLSTDVIGYEFGVTYIKPDEATENTKEVSKDAVAEKSKALTIEDKAMLEYVDEVLNIYTEEYERIEKEKGYKYQLRFALL